MRKNPKRSSVKFGNSLSNEIGGSEVRESLGLAQWICWQLRNRARLQSQMERSQFSGSQFHVLLAVLAVVTVRASKINYE
jgi:hypothetical protein